MIGTIVYLSLLAGFILLARRVYKSPISKTDPAFSLMWRGAVGGVVGGFFGLLILGVTTGGVNSPYFAIVLIFSAIFTLIFGMMFTGIVWLIQIKAGMFAGLIGRAVIGAMVGIIIGGLAGALYPFIEYDETQKRFYPSPDVNTVMHSALVFITLGVAIGMAAGIMAGPRNHGEAEADKGTFV